MKIRNFVISNYEKQYPESKFITKFEFWSNKEYSGISFDIGINCRGRCFFISWVK